VAVMLPAELESALGMLGVPWPTENEDELRECAAAYRACADGVTSDVAPHAGGAVAQVAAENSGDHIDALTGFWGDYQREDSGHLPSLATALHALADGHEIAASVVEIVKVFLVGLAAYVVAVLVWAAAAAVFTAGAAALEARTVLTGLRVLAQRAFAAFRRELERFFGETVTRGVEMRLRAILDAGAPRLTSSMTDLREGVSRRVGPEANATVGDLRDFALPDVNGSALSRGKAEKISGLSDKALLKSVFSPVDGWHVQAYRDSRVVVNGNHRIAELTARAAAAKEGSPITWDTPIYVEYLPG
jgi:hypothetical protein